MVCCNSKKNKMRVLQIINSLCTGGAEKLLADSIPLYRNKGIDMELLLLNGYEYPFYKKLKKERVTIHVLGTGKMKRVYNPILILKAIPYLIKFDIVHVHLFPSLYWVALAKVIGRLRTVLIYTEHNTLNRRMKGRLYNCIEKYIYGKYRMIISITKEIEDIQKHRFPEICSKFCVINNGIDLSSFMHGQSMKMEKEDTSKIVIQVSSFKGQKDQETLIRSFIHLPHDISLLLVGDGVNKTKCENLVRDLNLSARISFLGIREDIVDLLNYADIVVLSSHYEGLSLSCIEGLASGRPFVASDVPGLREIVSGAGLLFPESDDKSLAEIIIKLLSDKTFYDETTKNCITRAKEYDINIMVDKYIDLYKNLINEKC